MFTGIIEDFGKVISIKKTNSNIDFRIESSLIRELKIDQSISHNGVCLTVTDIDSNHYTVTAVEETLSKSNLRHLKKGHLVNLERCLRLGDRMDGHIVQGHIDTTGKCVEILNRNGSWLFRFSYPEEFMSQIISKGSISVNGVSLTVVEPIKNIFSVAIIPYTYQHTTFKFMKEGDDVNLEFDIIGKYIARHISLTESVNL